MITTPEQVDRRFRELRVPGVKFRPLPAADWMIYEASIRRLAEIARAGLPALTLGERKWLAGQIATMTLKLIESEQMIDLGWQMERKIMLPPDATADQVDPILSAFLAGTRGLFASMIWTLDADQELERFEKRMREAQR
jgi:hypothetical protein